jgi:hypothetical protein
MTLDELLLEWSYRTNKGYPCLDNPSDITILKSLLEHLKLPSNQIISELEKSFGDKDGEPGIAGMEDESPDARTTPEISSDEIISLINKNKNNNDLLLKIKRLITNSPAETSWKDNLANKANITDDTIDSSNAPKDLLDDLKSNDDLPAFNKYLNNPKLFSDLPKQGNLIDEFKDIGISQSSVVKIFDFFGSEKGRGVGRGEMGLALLCGDVKMASAGAGDLNWNGKYLEVKGSAARLGKRDNQFPSFNRSDLGILATKYDKSDTNLSTLISNLANEADINLDELLNAVINFAKIAHPKGNTESYFSKEILSNPSALNIAYSKNMAESYTNKYNIQHFFIWNSKPTSVKGGGIKYGDYVHFAANEMNNMIDEGTIRFGPAGIGNTDPSLAGGAPYS